MLTFLDGPAAGQELVADRAPRFLRVVQAPGGEWFALARVTDVVAPDELVTVYERTNEPAPATDVTRYGWTAGVAAEYKVLAEQPAFNDVLTNVAWQAWALQRSKQP